MGIKLKGVKMSEILPPDQNSNNPADPKPNPNDIKALGELIENIQETFRWQNRLIVKLDEVYKKIKKSYLS